MGRTLTIVKTKSTPVSISNSSTVMESDLRACLLMDPYRTIGLMMLDIRITRILTTVRTTN